MTQRMLITAGAGGIGLAIAKVFVAGGARLHIADIKERLSYMDTSGSSSDFFMVVCRKGSQFYIRPVGAGGKPAGPDGIR